MKKGTLLKNNNLSKSMEEYGTFLTMDSAGMYVVELAGGKGVTAWNKDDVEKVMPYTVTLQFIGGKDKDYAYLYNTDDEALNLYDIVLFRGPYGVSQAYITGVDTKSEHATQTLTPLAIYRNTKVKGA